MAKAESSRFVQVDPELLTGHLIFYAELFSQFILELVQFFDFSILDIFIFEAHLLIPIEP